ncbi:MAG: DUF2155 domain-containing protein [Acidobacteria bacterium]|nr:DUF2155 domain-containing protein [Acidobacteriota bacterium]MCA1612514.1 DUF2155 domain-containing protein [Acidobacteriota bacterium]
MTRAGFGVLLLLALADGCRERGRPDPAIRMAVSHERSEAPSGAAPAGADGSGTPRVPTKLLVPDSVTRAYSGIRLRWKDSGSGKEGTLDVPLGAASPVPGSTLEVRADVFLPAFTMTSDAITSTGIEPENPAARITVGDGGKEVFAGWIFTRFPDVHPFEHPRFSLRLEGGVRRTS